MRSSPRILVWSCCALACAAFALAQDGGGEFKKKDKGGKGGQDEDAKMVKLLEKSFKKTETERDKVVKELVKLSRDQELTNDYRQWYTRLAGNAGQWERATIEKKGIAEIFDRMVERLEIKGDAIPRDQFLGYARRYWDPDQSPPWKVGKEIDVDREIEKVFRHLDRDGDGVLREDEMPAALRADLRRWDRNGDGRIDLVEYRAYFPHRIDRLYREITEPEKVPAVETRAASDDKRPGVARVGRLPAGLPPWFAQLDIDQDGQIGMYEWRRVGWPIEEFKKLDLNDDGFLLPEEVLKLLTLTERGGTRPFAYLAEKTLSVTTPPGKIAKKGNR